MTENRKKPAAKGGKSGDGGRQVNFRADARLHARLEDVADGMGLDVSGVVRMILKENLHTYEARVQQTREREGGRADE